MIRLFESRDRRTVPYLRGTFLFGSAGQMRSDPLALLMRARRQHGDLVKMHLGPYPVYMLFHPDHVARVLQERPTNYLKDGYEQLEPMVGKGLLASEGDRWRHQRRIMQPAFHKNGLDDMASTMVETTESMLERWRLWLVRTNPGTPIDVGAEMSRLTFEIVGRTLFGVDLSETAIKGEKALELIFRYGFDRSGRYFQLPFGVPSPKNLRYHGAVRILDEIVWPLVEDRQREGPSARGDLLDMLLAAYHSPAEPTMTEKQLRDEVLTVMAAGYETTARALSWTFYLLAKNPNAAHKLREELHGVLGGRSPTAPDLHRLSYARTVLQESMRLFPPVWGLSRRLKDYDEVGGHRIPMGNRVIVSAYVTQRHPELWPEPDLFDPDRFLGSRSFNRPPPHLPRYAYFPFSGGPRQCIGVHFAAMEATLVLATVLQDFELSLSPGFRVEPQTTFTLRPRGGLPMILSAR